MHAFASLAAAARRRAAVVSFVAPLALASALAACAESGAATPTAPGTVTSAVVSTPTAAKGGGSTGGGAAALLARTHEVSQSGIVLANDEALLGVLCPAGEVATGGGFSATGAPNVESTINLVKSSRWEMTVDGVPRSGWRVELWGAVVNTTATVYATCVPLQ